MTHQIVFLDGKAAYMSTTVAFEKSEFAIRKMLEKFSCDDTIMRRQASVVEGTLIKDPIPFYTLAFRKDGLSYMIEFPVIIQQGPVRYNREDATKRRVRMDVSARVVHDRVKALLIDAEYRISDFSVAMMPYLAIADRASGQLVPLQDVVAKQREQLSSGGFDLLALPGARQ
jgi:hypothetical protein